MPSKPPISVTYMTDDCIKDKDGYWLLIRRRFEPWFEGDTPTTNPKLDDK